MRIVFVGASTTVNTADRQVWLWCTQPGNAYWYRMRYNQMPTILSLLTPEYRKRMVQQMYHEVVDADQELLAFGFAQVASGVTQGIPVGTSGSRTAVNDDMGATSQVSGLVAAAMIGIILLFLTGPIEYLPSAVLGAVIVVPIFTSPLASNCSRSARTSAIV